MGYFCDGKDFPGKHVLFVYRGIRIALAVDHKVNVFIIMYWYCRLICKDYCYLQYMNSLACK